MRWGRLKPSDTFKPNFELSLQRWVFTSIWNYHLSKILCLTLLRHVPNIRHNLFITKIRQKLYFCPLILRHEPKIQKLFLRCTSRTNSKSVRYWITCHQISTFLAPICTSRLRPRWGRLSSATRCRGGSDQSSCRLSNHCAWN